MTDDTTPQDEPERKEFTLEGRVTALSLLDDDTEVSLDGETLDPDDYDSPDMFEHTIEIEGSGEYFLEVEEPPLAISDTDDGDDGVMQSFPVDDADPKRVSGVIDGGTHTVTYDNWLCDVAVSDRDNVTITINDNYEPTWEMYPTENSDGRDWLDEVPWWDGEDEPPANPEPPTGLEVAFVGETAAAISWDEMDHADSYDVSLDSDPMGRTEATAYDLDNLEPETTYVAEVFSVGEDGWVSEPSSVQFVTVEEPLDPPAEISGLDVSEVTRESATVSWNVSDRATEYRVLLDGDRVDEIPQTEYKLIGLDAGTEYEVAVSAWNEAGETEPVPMTFETDDPPEEPDPPEDLVDRVDVLEAETEHQGDLINDLQVRVDGLDSRVMDLEDQVEETEEDVEDVKSWRDRLYGAFSR